jgi:hypothetical protein
VNYLTFPFLNEEDKKKILEECIFNDKDMFSTKMYDKDTALVFISTLIEGNLGIYKRKSDGFKIAYGEWTYPLTEQNNWSLYINNEIYTGDNNFTEEWLASFSDRYEFIGRESPSYFIENVKSLLSKLPDKTSVCFLLGSETPYKRNKSLSYSKREEYHKELNKLLRDFASINPRVYLIDINDYINSQDDFTNNINHFQRRIYFAVSKKANEIISSVTGNRFKEQGLLARLYLEYEAKIKDTLGDIAILRKIVKMLKAKLR